MMKHLVITGGVACGKSYVAQALERNHPGRVARLDSDAVNASLLRKPENIKRIAQHLGADLVVDGQIDRAALGQRVFAEPAQRRWLEDVMHPQIAAARQDWLADLEANWENQADGWTLLEIPLWFEAGLSKRDFSADQVLVVGAGQGVQRERLRRERGLTDARIEAVLASQWPLPRKLPSATLVCWNDGNLQMLDEQVRLLGQRLFS